MVEVEPFLENGYQHINRHGYPNLCLHRVGRGPVEGFDSKVLLYPFEKQFYLPPRLVQVSNNECWKHKVVGNEGQTFFCLGSVIRSICLPDRNIVSGIGSCVCSVL